jgi:hypothetical protein
MSLNAVAVVTKSVDGFLRPSGLQDLPWAAEEQVACMKGTEMQLSKVYGVDPNRTSGHGPKSWCPHPVGKWPSVPGRRSGQGAL